MISDHIQNSKLKVYVKPNSENNEILGYKEGRDAVVVRIKELAENNKANKELVNFISNELDKTVWLKSGYNSKYKTLVVEE